MTEIKSLTEIDDTVADTSDHCTSPVDVTIELQDAVITNSIPSYDEYMDLEMMFDISEKCMIWPSSEINTEMEYYHDTASIEEALLKSDDTCFLFAIQQIRQPDQSIDMCGELGFADESDSFDPYLFLSNLPDLPETVPSFFPVLLSRQPQSRLPITLVLDLDETLVHSTLDYCEDADFTFLVHFNMKMHTVYVRQRPYLKMFLETVAKMFEIIVFTASQSIYAEQLLDMLDPDHKLICHRVYRESCVLSEGGYIKDLTILDRDLAKVAIVDNSPQVFQLQVNNGIPIQSWFGDPSDTALVSLLFFLEMLVGVDDVRPIIASMFSCQ